jgi:hypothetical protein
MQRVLDAFYWFRKGLVTAIAYLSVRLYGSEASWDELWNERFTTFTHVNLDLNKVGDIDLVLAEARQRLASADSRQAGLADKCKTLLTLASLLVALVGALLLKEALEPLWLRILFFLSTLALANSVILVALVFGVRSEMTIAVEQQEAALSSLDLKKCLTNLYLRCHADRENQNDYLVEIYKVARFFFLLAFTLLIMEFSIGFFLLSPDSLAKATAKELRSDPTFLLSVKGDKGDRGDKGDQGPKGDMGPKGGPGAPVVPTQKRSP